MAADGRTGLLQCFMEIEAKIRQFIVETLYYSEDSPFADEDSFLETGIIDSMGAMELVAYVQSEFGVEVGHEEVVVENFDSIHKLANFVRRKLRLTAQLQAPQETADTNEVRSVAN